MHKLTILVLSAAFFVFGCSESSTETDTDTPDSLQTEIQSTDNGSQTEPVETLGADSLTVNDIQKVTAYICPNSCPEGKSEEAGNCPSCGMELIENPDYTAE